MNGFTALNTVLMAEALAVVLLILAAISALSFSRKNKDRAAVSDLIQTVSLTTDQHALELEEQLADIPDLDEEVLRSLLKSAKDNEKALYQHIITLYLKRDVRLLNQLSQKVDGLTNPYVKAMTRMTGATQPDANQTEALQKLQAEFDAVLREKRRLSKELRTITQTLDEVSNEYAQMFGGSRGIDEISASRKRMMDILENTLMELGDESPPEPDPLEGLPQ